MSKDDKKPATKNAGASVPQETLGIAEVGDQLDVASLAPLRALLNEQIAALNKDLQAATDSAVMDEIQTKQLLLAAKADELTGKSIQLATGEARVTAEHIKSAVDSAQKVIDKVKSIKSKLAKIGAVLDFAAAVLTGNGMTIVKGAKTLKDALDK